MFFRFSDRPEDSGAPDLDLTADGWRRGTPAGLQLDSAWLGSEHVSTSDSLAPDQTNRSNLHRTTTRVIFFKFDYKIENSINRKTSIT